jgi:hypothetical protein
MTGKFSDCERPEGIRAHSAPAGSLYSPTPPDWKCRYSRAGPAGAQKPSGPNRPSQHPQRLHRPKFLRGGSLDARGTAATARHDAADLQAEATKALAVVVRSSRSAGAAGVVRQNDAGGRGAELLKRGGGPGPVVEGERSEGRGGGLRGTSTCNHGPRRGAEREGRA